MKKTTTSGDTAHLRTSDPLLREEEHLSQQCVQFQKRRVFFIGPAMLAVTLWAYAVLHVWQLAFVSIVLAVTNVLFVQALRFAKKGRIEASLWLAVVPTLVTCMSVVTLLEGFDFVMGLTAVSIVVQASVFSRRISLLGAISIFLLLAVSQLLYVYRWVERCAVPSNVTFFASIIVGAVMVAQFWVYLRKHHLNNLHFLQKQKGLLTRQEDILSAVAATVPSVDETVGAITNVSNDVSKRAQEQAEAVEIISTAVDEITGDAARTTELAKRSLHISQKTQTEMTDNFTRLREVTNGFETVLSNMREARKIMAALVSDTDNIEKILSYNRDIGEHIKVLSVNASIEAAAAGEYGAGFAVVARELREMIDSTEKNLANTRLILGEIRLQSKAGMNSIDTTSQLLERFFGELTRTRETLDKALAGTHKTAEQSRQIVEGVEKQQDDLARMNATVQTLLDSAFELAVSSSLLIDTVGSMDHLKEELFRVVNID